MSVNHIEFLYIKLTPTCSFKETPPKTSHLQIDPSFLNFDALITKLLKACAPRNNGANVSLIYM